MSFSDEKKRIVEAALTSETQLDLQIDEKNNEIAELNKQIEVLKTEIDDANVRYQKRLQAMDKKQVAYNKELAKQKDRISKELIELEARQKEFRNKYEQDEADINTKIAEFRLKKEMLIDAEASMDAAAFERKKTSIDKRLKSLRETKRKQGEEFNRKMNEMKDEYVSLLNEKNDEKNSLEQQRAELVAQSNEEIEKLEGILNDVRKKHENALKQLAETQQAKLDEIRDIEGRRIDERNRELDVREREAEALEATRKDTLDELEALKAKNESDLEDLGRKYEDENRRFLNENNELAEQIVQKKEQLETDIQTHKEEYAKALEDLEALTVLLTDKKNKKAIDLKQRLAMVQPDLKEKYQNYVGELDQQFFNDKKKREEELATLEYNLTQEEEQLRNRNSFLDSRFNKRQEQYRQNIDDVSKNISGIQQQIKDLQKDFKHKSEDLNEDIRVMKNRNAEALENQKLENEEDLENTRKEFTQRRENIISQINAVKEKIGQVNKQIMNVQKEAEDYQSDFQGRKLNLEKDREASLKNIAVRKSELDQKMQVLQDKIAAKEKEHLKNIAQVDSKRQAATDEYEKKIAGIQAEYDAQVDLLTREHERQLEAASQANKEKLDAMNLLYDENIRKAEEAFEAKKQEYEAARSSIDSQLDAISQDTQIKLDALDQQKNNLLDSIAKIKIALEDRQIEFNNEVKKLQDEHAMKLQEMAEKQERDLAKITEEYELIPSRELQAIRDAYAEKQREFNDTVSVISSAKMKIDEEETDIRKNNAQKIDAANALLNETNGSFERMKSDGENLEKTFNSELTRRQQELETFKDELASQIQKIKDQKAAELDELNQKLDEQYAKAEKEYTDKQNTLQRQYDEKVKGYRNELQVKQENYDSLINEINARKEATEKECIEKYNVVAEQTKAIQKELDDLVNDNELKRSEISAAILQKQESFNAEIETIKNNYALVLDKKKNAYEEYITDVRGKCTALKDEIAELEKQKAIENSRLETYENEKRTLLADLRSETENTVNNISDKIQLLVKQSNDLKYAHNKRITYIKKQIASTMSEYDNLLRKMPDMINEAQNSDEFDLQERTQLFKEKLDTLEKIHKDILAELSDKCDETIEKITAEIDELEMSKTSKLKEYDEDIKNLSLAYDAMIRDENEKQNSLSNEIRKIETEQKEYLASLQNQDTGSDDDLKKEKYDLAVKFQEDIRNSSAEFSRLSAGLKAEFDELLRKRNALSSDVSVLVSRYKNMDDEIHQDEVRLKYELSRRILEARKLIEAENNRKKEKLNMLDIMGNRDVSIFK